MPQRFIQLTLLFSIMAIILAGCFGEATVTILCDRVRIAYATDGSDYTIEVFEAGTDNLVVSESGSVPSPSGTHTVYYGTKFAEGTSLYVVIEVDSETETFGPRPCGEGSSDGTTWFEPGDNRINRQAYAYAAIYCDDDNGRVGIYGIHSDGAGNLDDSNAQGIGFPAIFVPYDQLPPVPTAEAGNTFIAAYDAIRFYRLTTGEYQVNVGPDSEGKEYVVIWDNCPSSIVRAYILKDGVLTQTEVYPR